MLVGRKVSWNQVPKWMDHPDARDKPWGPKDAGYRSNYNHNQHRELDV
jgi:hypothetical protein